MGMKGWQRLLHIGNDIQLLSDIQAPEKVGTVTGPVSGTSANSFLFNALVSCMGVTSVVVSRIAVQWWWIDGIQGAAAASHSVSKACCWRVWKIASTPYFLHKQGLQSAVHKQKHPRLFDSESPILCSHTCRSPLCGGTCCKFLYSLHCRCSCWLHEGVFVHSLKMTGKAVEMQWSWNGSIFTFQ